MRDDLNISEQFSNRLSPANFNETPHLLEEFLSQQIGKLSFGTADAQYSSIVPDIELQFHNSNASESSEKPRRSRADADFLISPEELEMQHKEWARRIDEIERQVLDQIKAKEGKPWELSALHHLKANLFDLKHGVGPVNTCTEGRLFRCKADLLESKGDTAGASEELIKAIAITEARRSTVASSPGDQALLASNYAQLAENLRKLGDPKAAAAIFERGINSLEGWYGNDAARQLCKQYVEFLKDLGKPEEARKWLEVQKKLLPSEYEHQYQKSEARPGFTKDCYEHILGSLQALKSNKK